MESSGYNVAYIPSPICNNRLMFGKGAFFILFFQNIDMDCKGPQTNMPQFVGSKEGLIRQRYTNFFRSNVLRPIRLRFMPIYFIFWSRRSIDLFYSSDMLYILHDLSRHVLNVGFVHPISSLRDINATLELVPSRRHVIWRDSVGVGVQCRA